MKFEYWNIILGIVIIIIVYYIYLNNKNKNNNDNIEGFQSAFESNSNSNTIERLIETDENTNFTSRIWDNQTYLSSIYDNKPPYTLLECPEKGTNKVFNNCPISIWRPNMSGGYDSIGDVITRTLKNPSTELINDVRKPKVPGAITEKNLSTISVSGIEVKEVEDFLYIGGFGDGMMIDRLEKSDLYYRTVKKLNFYFEIFYKALTDKINNINTKMKALLIQTTKEFYDKIQSIDPIYPVNSSTINKIKKFMNNKNNPASYILKDLSKIPLQKKIAKLELQYYFLYAEWKWIDRTPKSYKYDIEITQNYVMNPYKISDLVEGIPRYIIDELFKKYNYNILLPESDDIKWDTYIFKLNNMNNKEIFKTIPNTYTDLTSINNLTDDTGLKEKYDDVIKIINQIKEIYPQMSKKTYNRLSVWQPVPPAGYVPLGFIFTNDEKELKPSKQLIKCIPESCAKSFKRRPWSPKEDIIFRYADNLQSLVFYRNPFLGTVVVIDEMKQNGLYKGKTPSSLKYRNEKQSLSWECFDIIPCIKGCDYVKNLEMADKSSKQMCKAFSGIENKYFDKTEVKQSLQDEENKLHSLVKGKKQYLDTLMNKLDKMMSEDELYKLITQGLNRYKVKKDLEEQRKLHGEVADKLMRTRGLEIGWGNPDDMGKFKELVKNLVVAQYTVKGPKRDCPVCKLPDTADFVKLKDLELCYGCMEDAVRELIGKKKTAGEPVPQELLDLEKNF